MIELTLKAGGRIAVTVSEVSAVLEVSGGCRIIFKNGWAVDVSEEYSQIGNDRAWKLQ